MVRGPWFVARLWVTVTVTVVAMHGVFEGFCEGFETADGRRLGVVGVVPSRQQDEVGKSLPYKNNGALQLSAAVVSLKAALDALGGRVA